MKMRYKFWAGKWLVSKQSKHLCSVSIAKIGRRPLCHSIYPMSGRALEHPKWIWKSGHRYSRQGFTAPPLPTCSPLQINTILGLIIHWLWQWVPAGISGLHLSSPQEASNWIVRFFLARKESVGLANAASMLNISPCTQKNPRQQLSWGGRPGETSSLAYS